MIKLCVQALGIWFVFHAATDFLFHRLHAICFADVVLFHIVMVKMSVFVFWQANVLLRA
jgi:hypothetical protein